MEDTLINSPQSYDNFSFVLLKSLTIHTNHIGAQPILQPYYYTQTILLLLRDKAWQSQIPINKSWTYLNISFLSIVASQKL